MKSIEAKSPNPIISAYPILKQRQLSKERPKELPEGPGVGKYKDADKRYVSATDPKKPCYSFGKSKRHSFIFNSAYEKRKYV